MDKNLKKFMAAETRSSAQILDDHYVEVQTQDGEIFRILSDIAKYDSDESRYDSECSPFLGDGFRKQAIRAATDRTAYKRA